MEEEKSENRSEISNLEDQPEEDGPIEQIQK